MKTLIHSIFVPVLVATVVASSARAEDTLSLEPVTKTSETIQRAADGSVVSVQRTTESVIYHSRRVTETLAPREGGAMVVTSRDIAIKHTNGTTINERETLDKETGQLVLVSRSTTALGANGSRIQTSETRNPETKKLRVVKRVITTRDDLGNTIVTEESRDASGKMVVKRQVFREGHYVPILR